MRKHVGYYKMKQDKAMLLTIDDKGAWKFMLLGLMQDADKIVLTKKAQMGLQVWRASTFKKETTHDL